MKIVCLVLTIVLFCAIGATGDERSKNANVMPAVKSVSGSEAALRATMTELWGSRSTLLRDYVISMPHDGIGAEGFRAKLIDNASELGSSIRPYYGRWADGVLAGLLKKDVLLTGKVMEAAMAGPEKEVAWAKKKWYANAYMLAGFLAIARNQTIKELKDMLFRHLDLTWGAMMAVLERDAAKQEEFFDKDRVHMNIFSDILTESIIKQFPRKFKG